MNDIYQRQRVMKDKLEELDQLDDIRNFLVGSYSYYGCKSHCKKQLSITLNI
ncbi:TPA: hypothetical protein ACS7WW_003017 [Providencia alcalifaciens]